MPRCNSICWSCGCHICFQRRCTICFNPCSIKASWTIDAIFLNCSSLHIHMYNLWMSWIELPHWIIIITGCSWLSSYDLNHHELYEKTQHIFIIFRSINLFLIIMKIIFTKCKPYFKIMTIIKFFNHAISESV